jgi:TolB-like protein
VTAEAAGLPQFRFLSELKRRNVFRVAATYLGSSWLAVHVGTVLGETFEPLRRAMPVVIFVLAAGLPIVLIATWFFERTPEGLRLTRRVEQKSSLRELAGRKLDSVILAVLGVAIAALLADRWWLHRPTEQSMLVLLAVMVAVMVIDRLVPRTSAAAAAALADGSVPAAAPAVSVPATKPRLAVLPFENLSPDPANAFFTDGLHEEILSTLARRARGLEVISRTTMMGYRREPKPLATICRELSASHVLEGTVRREEDTVRVTLQLIDAHTDGHVWSHSYDRTLAKALTLQTEVAGEVASQLSVHFAGAAQSAAPLTRDPRAYDLYLKARLAGQLLGFYAPFDAFLSTEKLLTEALALDPAFAAAYVERANVRLLMFTFNYDATEERAQRVREDFSAARRLTPGDPGVLGAEAQYASIVEQDHRRALAGFREAEGAGLADWMSRLAEAWILLRTGHVDEALRLGARLVELDPGNPFLLAATAGMFLQAKRPGESVRTLDRGIERYPEFVPLHVTRAWGVWMFTGRADAVVPFLSGGGQASDPEFLLDQQYNLLLYQHRLPELRELVGATTFKTARVFAGSLGGVGFGYGRRPVAEYRGWVHLLLGEASLAAQDGHEVLEFVSQQKELESNRLFLRALTAVGHVFCGQQARAIELAQEFLRGASPEQDLLNWRALTVLGAQVLAWSGRRDDAVTLLEALASSATGPPPTPLAKNPLFSVPLAGNARFQQLVATLEAQMRETRL